MTIISLCLLFLYPPLLYAVEADKSSIVAPEDAISDFEARLTLARVLSYNDQTLDEAMEEYEVLLREKPGDKEIGLELSQLYLRKDQKEKAFLLLESLLRGHPQDADLLVGMARIEASLGHAKKCRQLYMEALQTAPDPENISLQFAESMNLWGDFYRGERIYLDYLRNHPETTEVALKLAWVLASSERYEEAEGLYRKLLLKDPNSDQVLLKLVHVKLLEKDFQGSLAYAQALLSNKPEDPEGLSLKAEALWNANRHEEALEIYTRLSENGSHRVKGLLDLGKVYLKQNKPEPARACFEKAYRIDPQNIEVQFYWNGLGKVVSDDFLKKILKAKKSPATLAHWGQLYGSHGLNKAGIACYEAALEGDPEYFPARMALAQILAVDHQYDRAIRTLNDLAADFPDDSKILIWRARVLGWSKRYRESIDLYEKIHQLNPMDPIPQKEKARAAIWGKMIERAMETYEAMLRPPVDQKLLFILDSMARQVKDTHFLEMVGRIREIHQKGSIYQGYEAFSKERVELQDTFSAELRNQLENVYLDLLPCYKIQKAAFVESRAKWLTWNKRLVQAMETYESLIAFQPGNQEAIFDYAQIQCALGLYDQEAKAYKQLLEIDPLHQLAGMALEKQEIKSRPSLQLNHSYWDEKGRGELAQITRQRTDLVLDVPILRQYHLRLTAQRWIENPKGRGETFVAYGQTLEFNGVLNPYLKGALGWTNKRYEKSLDTRNTGYAHLEFNLKDYARLGLGYDRTDELYNVFGLKKGIQADAWWISANSNLTRQLEIGGKARYLKYNDDNEGKHYSLSASYAFTDHPKIFKVTLSGDYRDTKHEDLLRFQGKNLVDIIHPYWTPQNYTAGSVTLGWYHDLSKDLFCGSNLHFYDLRASLGTDSERNPSVQFEGEWHYEFLDRWTIGIKGLIHRSLIRGTREWNAKGSWLNLKYQF